jgi:hypothetical protein
MPPVRCNRRGALLAAPLALLPLLPLPGTAQTQNQTQWAPLPSSTAGSSPSTTPSWLPLPTADRGSDTPAVLWQPLPGSPGQPADAGSVN